MRYVWIGVVAVLLVGGVAIGDPLELPQIMADGLMALDPPQAGSCIAVRVELSLTQELVGVAWQGSGEIPFASIRVGSGAGDLPPVYADAVPVAANVACDGPGWTTLVFDQPIASVTGSLYVIFVYPTGIPDLGSAPGVGYAMTETTHLVYLSAEGEEWAQFATGYRLLVEPILEGRSPGTIALFAQPQAPPQPMAPLLRVYPNPFNPTTTIALQNVGGAGVELAVYNLQGRRVRTLFTGESSGQDVIVNWDGRDDSGHRQASGIYLVRAYGEEVDMRARVVMVK